MAEACRQPNKTDAKTVVFLKYRPPPNLPKSQRGMMCLKSETDRSNDRNCQVMSRIGLT